MAAIEDRHISLLTDRPAALRDKIFDRLFQVAEIAKFTPTELREYEDSLKAYRDLKNSLDTAEEKGVIKGIEIGRAEGEQSKAIDIAKNLKSMGLSIAATVLRSGAAR